jgi:hypothetical protein
MIKLATPRREEAGQPAKSEVEILRELAAGRCPFTGEELPIENCYQSTEVVRALFAAIGALEREAKPQIPRNAGRSWSPEEDASLGSRFDRGVPIPELAREHERTRGAIVSRLEKLGKIGLAAAVVNALRGSADNAPATAKLNEAPLGAARVHWKK